MIGSRPRRLPGWLALALAAALVAACGSQLPAVQRSGALATVDPPASLPPPRPAAIVTGWTHSCVLTDRGTVRCWGENSQGELGDGTTAVRDAPVDVAGLDGVVQLSAADRRTCALRRDGTVWCWGTPGAYQRRPAQVPMFTDVVAIATSTSDLCAVRRGGDVVCRGELMHFDAADVAHVNLTPVPISGIRDAVSVTALWGAFCAIDRGAHLWCWDEQGKRPVTAREVTALSDVRAVVEGWAGRCALRGDGSVWCWKAPEIQREVAEAFTNVAPRPVPALAGSRVLAGGWRICAVGGDGIVRCTGERSEPGYERIRDPAAPVFGEEPGAPRGPSQLAIGVHTTCALGAGGASCWGRRTDLGMLGDGDGLVASSAAPVAGITARAISAGRDATCAQLADGGVRCWGANELGQLGDGSHDDRSRPVDVPVPAGTEQVIAASDFACVRTASADVWCWGSHSPTEGDGQIALAPMRVPELHGMTMLSAGGGRGMIIAVRDGLAYSFGDCDGLRFRPFRLPAFDGVVAATEDTYGCGGVLGIRRDGTVIDQVSRGPHVMPGIGPASAVAAGTQHACALLRDGTVTCWGRPLRRPGRIRPEQPPSLVRGLSRARQLVVGDDFACALRDDGTVWCWGANYFGQVGDASYQGRSAPVQIVGLSGVKDVASGGSHSCAIDSGGKVVCWGLGASGQLGNGISEIVRPVGVRMTCP